MSAPSSEESLISVENDDCSKYEYEDHGDSSSPDLVRLDADINDIVVSHHHIQFLYKTEKKIIANESFLV